MSWFERIANISDDYTSLKAELRSLYNRVGELECKNRTNEKYSGVDFMHTYHPMCMKTLDIVEDLRTTVRNHAKDIQTLQKTVETQNALLESQATRLSLLDCRLKALRAENYSLKCVNSRIDSLEKRVTFNEDISRALRK